VFLYRPAPVQVTWIGYPNTTGLAAMDWRITDWWADPQGEEQYHSEKLCRLTEGFLCYRPSPEAPPLSPPPAVRKGYITFGSFNSLPKVTSRVVALWSRVLRTVPGSRLLLKSKPFADPGTRRRYRELFARHGIGSGRLELRGNVASVKEHLATYDEVDIALDPFPYNGTTTTCEALWMGVPVVGLAGKHHAARVGLSLLSRVGLAGMVATDEDGYSAVARMLASDPARLAALRKGLRPAVANSSLCNARAFVAGLEEAYERMWAAGGERK
jgi:predicted O-linked N-acetylglucosamine transferase (SPINDLY family)